MESRRPPSRLLGYGRVYHEGLSRRGLATFQEELVVGRWFTESRLDQAAHLESRWSLSISEPCWWDSSPASCDVMSET